MATTESANERFERLAEHFCADTGMLAPGKDDPTGHHSEADRREAWRAWLDALREQEVARTRPTVAAAIALMDDLCAHNDISRLHSRLLELQRAMASLTAEDYANADRTARHAAGEGR